MFEEDRMLRDASSACSQALLLAPDHPVVASAHAHFLSRTGRNDEAIELYRSVNEDHPSHAAAFEGLAAALLDGYRQTAERAMLDEARSAARQAAAVDPTIWKPLFNLAAMEYFSNDLDAAIADDAKPNDLVRPGHIFPLRAKNGGAIVRAGQTEGSVDLARQFRSRYSSSHGWGAPCMWSRSRSHSGP